MLYFIIKYFITYLTAKIRNICYNISYKVSYYCESAYQRYKHSGGTNRAPRLCILHKRSVFMSMVIQKMVNHWMWCSMLKVQCSLPILFITCSWAWEFVRPEIPGAATRLRASVILLTSQLRVQKLMMFCVMLWLRLPWNRSTSHRVWGHTALWIRLLLINLQSFQPWSVQV